MKAFQENLQKLEAADTQVLGVSVDSPFANHAFAEQNGVTFPLLSDMEAKTVSDYGLEKDYPVGGPNSGVKIKSARRATFLIDKEGKVVEESVDNEAVDPTKIVTACERKKLKS
jgi:peroxiredoxin